MLSLDVSHNSITSLTQSDVKLLRSVRDLFLAGNPLTAYLTGHVFLNASLPRLQRLDLSSVPLVETDFGRLRLFHGVAELNLTQCRLDRLQGGGFQSMKRLRVLDLRGSALTVFTRGIFDGLHKLEVVYADNYKMCCPGILPDGFDVAGCHAPSDEISSCDALLRSSAYRTILAVFSTLSLLGNTATFLYRVVAHRVKSGQGFGVFVLHLCVADFLMGVYLAHIGVADRMYEETYLWNEVTWRHSPMCMVAGFCSLLSSEVSALIVCLITVDRCLVLRFPFSRYHFKRASAHLACALTWGLGLVLATVPLLPVTAHWNFYGQSGICIPLPVTRQTFPGHAYSFGVMIVFNFLLFMLIAVGQGFIYWSVKAGSRAVHDSSRRSKDLTIARRLITVAVPDFLCWFPIGLLGLLASNGSPVPGEVNVATAIIVLPVNSALNPFLYTLNTILEKRRRLEERRLQKLLLGRLESGRDVGADDDVCGGSCTETAAWGQLVLWLDSGTLTPGQVGQLLSEVEKK